MSVSFYNLSTSSYPRVLVILIICAHKLDINSKTENKKPFRESPISYVTSIPASKSIVLLSHKKGKWSACCGLIQLGELFMRHVPLIEELNSLFLKFIYSFISNVYILVVFSISVSFPFQKKNFNKNLTNAQDKKFKWYRKIKI